ncbi:hypothetical protein PIROE2DRAFT_11524 [Piromyces sp. E2]|nr:hypothetical protein PIROE2DRAFT_11524 [Piromyces sp. E2]|eukprot:OUM62266.1 hypothetical protein PIROE2DRAFT_11524 [Piromyces sp. E2]
MFKKYLYLFFFVYIAFLFTTINGLTKKEVLKLQGGQYYCKDDICASTKRYFDVITIPNKEGKNITYITETCSASDIDLGLCSSKQCTADSQCLSNKCIKGHCSFNENNPIVHCQYIRTIFHSSFFRGYKMKCGSPRGDKCKFDRNCSSNNCIESKNNKICGEARDGCTSLCEDALIIAYIIYIIVIANYKI